MCVLIETINHFKLKLKTNFQLSRERDALHRQLDDRAIEEQNLRRSLQEVTLKVEQSDASKSRYHLKQN